MADTFEDVKNILPGTPVVLHVEDGTPLSGVLAKVDEAARTVTLQPGSRVIAFPPAEPTEP